jgi:hypothetical protein
MTDGVTAGAARAGGAGGELTRMIASFAWVLAATAAALAVLGAAPRWLSGESGAVRAAATLEDAERRLGARVLVPGYFPDRLAWPPAEIHVAGGRRGSVRLAFAARDGGPGVEVLQATADDAAIAPDLLRDRTVLRSARTTVAAVPATLSDVIVDGRPARELAWAIHGRAMILRSAGDLEELFRMARSAHREGGR